MVNIAMTKVNIVVCGGGGGFTEKTLEILHNSYLFANH